MIIVEEIFKLAEAPVSSLREAEILLNEHRLLQEAQHKSVEYYSESTGGANIGYNTAAALSWKTIFENRRIEFLKKYIEENMENK